MIIGEDFELDSYVNKVLEGGCSTLQTLNDMHHLMLENNLKNL